MTATSMLPSNADLGYSLIKLMLQLVGTSTIMRRL